jgi:hypothetical protein
VKITEEHTQNLALNILRVFYYICYVPYKGHKNALTHSMTDTMVPLFPYNFL